jgi:hypothetical protein
MLDASVGQGMATLKGLVEADAATARAAPGGLPEPDVPGSRGRNVREPVAAAG